MSAVRQLRLVLTVDDFDAAVAMYCDALGLEEREAWEASAENGRIVILEAGRATLELVNEEQAAAIDAIEVGSRVAGAVRIAFEVDDSAASAARLEQAGAERLGGPLVTPWQDRNVRLRVSGGMQLTLFSSGA